MEINISERFKKKYRGASPRLQGLAEGAIRDFVNLYRADPRTVLLQYDRLAHIPYPVLEMKLSGGHRLLAQLSDDILLLLDMGGHEVVGQYDKKKLGTDQSNHEPASPVFWPENRSTFFVPIPTDIPYQRFQEEVSPEWLFFLDDEQYAVFDQIASALIDGERQHQFIIGGPGTGKTCILLNLLKFFVEESDFVVGVIFSEKMSAFIESSQMDISPYRVGLYDHPPLDLLLVDDPDDLREVLKTSGQDRVETIVAAFDPLQLPYDLTDRKLELVSSDFIVSRHELKTCYRQKENVGISTKRIIDIVEASTPFLKQDKIDKFRKSREHLSRLSNDLEFKNPFGYTQFYPASTTRDVKVEVDRILKDERLMWRHWPGLLILLDGYTLSEEVNNAFAPLHNRNYIRQLTFNEIEDVKGMEFQHVFIFIDKKLYEELSNGFKGSGQKEYHRRRLYRIPFSRAKDSLVIFEIEGSSNKK